MTATNNPTQCHKCDGTGFITFSHVDGGRCFACNGTADTSYTQTTDWTAEHARLVAEDEAARIARRAARAAKREIDERADHDRPYGLRSRP